MTAYAMVVVADGKDATETWEWIADQLRPVDDVQFIGEPWQVITEDEYDTARLFAQAPPEVRRVR